MGHAARAAIKDDPWIGSPANDNSPRSGDPDADRWHWIITRLKTIHTAAAVQAAAFKLSGMSPDEFCCLMRQAIETLGWPQAQSLSEI